MLGAIIVDGNLNEEDWQKSSKIVSFFQVNPRTGESSNISTQVNILSNSEGIYIGTLNLQNPNDLISKFSSRDTEFLSDYNKYIIDFDNNGSKAYEFSIANGDSVQDAIWTNGNNRNLEWDGIWMYSTSKLDLGWCSEIFIPWSIAPMISLNEDMRTIGIYIERGFERKNITVSNANINSNTPGFLKAFKKITIKNYATSSLDSFVTISGSYDVNDGSNESDIGGDLFWKPSTGVQISVTVNPDFSQVESDELSVSFTPEETFFNEKRPFFTQDQAIFKPLLPISTPNVPELRLIHTRRIGGSNDLDPDKPSRILAAGKYTYSSKDWNLGLLSALEGKIASKSGRNFFATRITRYIDRNSLGFIATQTIKPDLERKSLVLGGESSIELSTKSTVNASLFSSRISEENAIDKYGHGGFINLNHNSLKETLTNQVQFLYLDEKVDVNDIGFLSRNNLRYIGYKLKYQDAKKDPHILTDDYLMMTSYRQNLQKEELTNYSKISFYRRYSDTSDIFAAIIHYSSGIDDLALRGNGSINVKSYTQLFVERFFDKTGDLRTSLAFWLAEGGLAGNEHWLHSSATYFFNDISNIAFKIYYQRNNAWKKWTGLDENVGPILSSFNKDEAIFEVEFNQAIDSIQEIRLKAEFIGIKAQYRESYSVLNNSMKKIDEPLDSNFYLSKLGLQLRYQWAINKSSMLYLVYSRGGSEYCINCNEHSNKILMEGLENSASNQFYVKLKLEI